MVGAPPQNPHNVFWALCSSQTPILGSQKHLFWTMVSRRSVRPRRTGEDSYHTRLPGGKAQREAVGVVLHRDRSRSAPLQAALLPPRPYLPQPRSVRPVRRPFRVTFSHAPSAMPPLISCVLSQFRARSSVFGAHVLCVARTCMPPLRVAHQHCATIMHAAIQCTMCSPLRPSPKPVPVKPRFKHQFIPLWQQGRPWLACSNGVMTCLACPSHLHTHLDIQPQFRFSCGSKTSATAYKQHGRSEAYRRFSNRSQS